ncbi:MAG: IS3 family transposase [Fusobacteriaceae bacterium]
MKKLWNFVKLTDMGNGYIFETNEIISAIIKFEFIQVHSKVHSINILCKVCGVSRSGYYKYLASKAKRLEKEAQKIVIVNKIKKNHIDSRRTYDSPRIAAVLNANGHVASTRLVAKLMKQNSIHAISHKKFRAKAS